MRQFHKRLILAFLLFTGVLINVGHAQESPGDQLLKAARDGDLAKIKKLVDSGVDVNFVDQFGITPIWQAAPVQDLSPCASTRREPLDLIVAADEFTIHKDLRHGRPTAPLLEQLLNRPVARFPDTIELGDVHAQTSDLTKHAQRVLRARSVTLREDHRSVA